MSVSVGVGVRVRGLLFASSVMLMTALPGCGLFETRDPESPSSSNCFSQPPTRPGIVLENLQNAIAQKCVDNYAACFANPSNSDAMFVFVPSAEARDQYGAVMADWSSSDEQAYFRNLVARGVANGFASLFLVPRDSVITQDSVQYNFDYTFTFEHHEAGFPITARGNLQFTLSPNASNFWSIQRWADFKSGDDITWSLFKGRFSN